MIQLIINLIWFLLVFNSVLFYLDDFNLNRNKFINFVQQLSLPLLIILIYLIYIENSQLINEYFEFAGDANTTSKPKSSVVRADNTGLGASIAAGAAATASVISKSSLPPLQKAAIVVAGATISGAAFTGLNALNNNISQVIDNNSSSVDNTKNFLESHNNSDLSTLILSIDLINGACLSLVLILFIMLIFKLLIKEENIIINFSSLIGSKWNNSLNYYIIKLYKVNQKTSVLYIFIALFLLLIGLGFNSYFLTVLYSNLDQFVNLHSTK
jgi:hypothetical protein